MHDRPTETTDGRRRPAARPSAFDVQFDAHRAAVLRRRLAAYCLVALLPYAVLSAGAVAVLPPLRPGPERDVAAWYAAQYGVQVALFVAGLLAAVFARRPRRAAAVRLSVLLAAVAWAALVAGNGWRPSAPVVRPGPAPLALAFSLLLPCLLLPWTLAESLAAAGAMVAVAWAAAAWDAAAGRAGGWPAAAVAATACAAAAVPGCAVGWWRYSRFRGHYRLRFESDAYRRLRAELEGARRVHEACLPPPQREGPVAVGYAYEPMQQIGGDLVFVHPPPPVGAVESMSGPVSVVVLDVTGHGIAAALAVNRLYGELRRVFAEAPAACPGAVLAALNRYVYLTLADLQVHATALCLRADPAAGVLRWASGGHPTAFLLRRPAAAGTAAAAPTDLGSTAMLLGAADGDDFDPDPAEVPFAAGDVVVAYTDGAAEAADAAGAMLGTAGVRRLAVAAAAGGRPPLDWPADVLARVAAHRDGPPADDVLVVVVARAAEGGEVIRPPVRR